MRDSPNPPLHVDGRAQIFVLSVFAAAFRNSTIMHWVTAGIFIDFCLRFVGGAQVSILGSIAMFVAARLKPNLGAGPPKQVCKYNARGDGV